MAIKLNSIKCPECGASLSIEKGNTQVVCPFCETKVIVTNENEHIYKNIDEADIKRADTERMVKMRQLNMEELRFLQGYSIQKILTMVWMVLSVIILVICIIRWAVLGDFFNGFGLLLYLGGPVIGGGAYLVFKYIPEKEAEKAIMNNGGVRIPQDIFPVDEKNYQAVYTSLHLAGFQNVTCINMHDLTLGLLQKPGRVESVSVNGEKIGSGGRYYYPDVQITVSYHGR